MRFVNFLSVIDFDERFSLKTLMCIVLNKESMWILKKLLCKIFIGVNLRRWYDLYLEGVGGAGIISGAIWGVYWLIERLDIR